MRRFFIAVDIPEEVAEILSTLVPEGSGIRPVDSRDFHLTLRFLGEVPDPVAAEIQEMLTQVEAPRFQVDLGNFGFFPGARNPRIFWVGAFPVEPLAKLKKCIDRTLSEFPLEPDARAFLPHVTLARLNRPDERVLADFMEKHHQWKGPSFQVCGFSLYESRLHPDGANYHSLGEYRIGNLRDFLLE